MGNDRPTLYVGVSNDILRRVYEHKNNLSEGFTKTYKLHKLLYFEMTSNVEDAISREKQIKHWNRTWKLDLIKEMNPELKDLYDGIANC